mgnify:FL=1
MSDYKFIKSYEKDGCAWISINRPPLNVLDIPTMAEMNEAIREVKSREAE